MTKLESKAYNGGYDAANRGRSIKDNPYLTNTDQGKAWLRGYQDAKAA